MDVTRNGKTETRGCNYLDSIHLSVCIFVCSSVCRYVYQCVSLFVCMSICYYVYLFLCSCACVCVSVCLSINQCVPVCVCVYIYIHIYYNFIIGVDFGVQPGHVPLPIIEKLLCFHQLLPCTDNWFNFFKVGVRSKFPVCNILPALVLFRTTRKK